MKAVVVYDSYYGNTKAIAEAIAEELKVERHQVDLRSVRQKHPAPRKATSCSWGRRSGWVRPPAKSRNTWRSSTSTCGKTNPWSYSPRSWRCPDAPTDQRKESREKYDIAAGRKLGDVAKSQGLNVIDRHLWVDVKGNKGPLVENAIEETKQFTRDVLRTMEV